MTQRRMLANASFRLSDSNVTHDVSERSPSEVRVCQGCGEAFDRSVTGKNNAATAVGRRSAPECPASSRPLFGETFQLFLACPGVYAVK